MAKGRIFSGMRPTGRLHIGHLSVLENWVKMQDEYECFYGVVDWHALTTAFDDTSQIKDNIREMLIDWLSAGIDPEKSAVLVQSHVKEHAELHLLFSMITPLSWLERVPTYKDQVQQLGQEGKDISTYGFLGYPLLQAADILVYKADTVPVGEDQLPHLELCREIARRFNFMYDTKLFPEPKAKLAKVAMLPGIDGRKMSKSYHNDIAISASPQEVQEKIRMMVTDPARVRKDDPGHPEVCVVYAYQQIYNAADVENCADCCRGGTIGCVACKKNLAAKMNEVLEPVRERRARLEANPGLLDEIVIAGVKRARQEAAKTMEEVREAMKI
ncbi:tryptophan--tRNA ligase [Clostridiales bacterium PH28_bin88]|nr:tryptophan--tRNA ligase [Clostridiales bacterium PH28_bin88]